MAKPPSSTTADRTATDTDSTTVAADTQSTGVEPQPTKSESQPTEPGSQSTEPDSQSTTDRLPFGGRRIDLAALLWIAGMGCLLAVGWLSAGVIGLAVGAGVGAVAYRSRPVVAVALAQAGLLVVIPAVAVGRPLAELAAFQGGLMALLLSERPVDRPTVVLTVAVSIVLAAVVVAALSWSGLAAASAAVVVLAAAMGYAIHRFERVSLGLATPTETATGDSYE